MAYSNFLIDYWYYQLCSSSESISTPFDYLTQYINEHPGVRCFIFADHCTKDDVDVWLNDERVKVYWWEDMTKTHANNPEDFDGLSDFIETLNGLIKPDFGAVIEVHLPATSEELFSLYYPTNSCPAGKMVITNGDDLDDQIIQQFRVTFGNDVEGEDIRPYLKNLYGGWVMLGYEVDSNARLGGDCRWEYVAIPSYSDVDVSSISWALSLESTHIIF